MNGKTPIAVAIGLLLSGAEAGTAAEQSPAMTRVVIADPVLKKAVSSLEESLSHSQPTLETVFLSATVLMNEARFIRNAYPEHWKEIRHLISEPVKEAAEKFTGKEWRAQKIHEFAEELEGKLNGVTR